MRVLGKPICWGSANNTDGAKDAVSPPGSHVRRRKRV